MKNGLVLSVLLGLVFASAGLALSYEEVQNNYALSYKAEAELNYPAAISPMLSMLNKYDSQKYHFTLRLAWLNYLNGSYEASANYYKQAAALMPGALDPLLGLMLPAMAAGNWDEALQAGASALSIDARNYYALSRTAYSYYCKGDFANAESSYKSILDLYPTDLNMQLGLGWTYLKQGNKQEAEKIFKLVLLRSPENYSATLGIQSLK
jgi:tetratricopeptide (TPR) repeat protein